MTPLGFIGSSLLSQCSKLFAQLSTVPTPLRIAILNALRKELSKYSPFSTEPVDCVQWIPCDLVGANDYNPNSVAPPEMKLLEVSIGEDGYTQPVVAWATDDGRFEVVDGFHRTKICKESVAVRERVLGHLPLAIINTTRLDRGDRIAATIRHNRARGKHRIDAMSDIVVELKRRNWTDDKIGRELGMEPDEVLRLTQITGLAEMFLNEEFSQAWDVGAISDEVLADLDGSVTEMEAIEHLDDGSSDE